MRGSLIVLSGFSGSGKDTVLHSLCEKYEGRYAVSISATTREPREGEREAVDYFFLSREEFEEKITQDCFLEYAEYSGAYYGTLKEHVLSKMEKGLDVFLEIEVQGAMQVKKLFPEALMIFITPPTAEILMQRLRNRGTETEEKIQKRMNTAKTEVDYIKEYDYLLINDRLDDCVEQLHRMVLLHRSNVMRCSELIADFKRQLNCVQSHID